MTVRLNVSSAVAVPGSGGAILQVKATGRTGKETNMAIEVLRELWRIVERRDGCVYRTEYVRDVWVLHGTPPEPIEDHILVPKSTTYDGPTIRHA